MKIYPAIDLKDGQCVRLRQGRAEEATVYSGNPVETALRWEAEGGEFLHLVDLDGAFDGSPRHTAVLSAIAKALKIPVEIGGGLRTDGHIRDALAAGAARVIIGTRAVSEPEVLKHLVKEFGGDRIAVGIDAKNGFVQVKGWVETTSTKAVDLARIAAETGVKTIIYTDTATDGMMAGPNLSAMAAMCDAIPGIAVVASGGVSKVEDVSALAALKRANLDGVIVGKALYTGAATLPALIDAAR